MNQTLQNRTRMTDAARSIAPADCVFQNALVFHPFTCEWEKTNIAVKDGIIIGLGDYEGTETIDCKGSKIIPGLIDAHLHIESSLLTPGEYGRLVLPHGTTTVIADPHEIANVAGAAGIRYMLAESRRTPLDIFFMLPSCVPATPFDKAGAELSASDLQEFLGDDHVLGLAEMMNVPGVLANDPTVLEKLDLCSCIDGHAPLLSGPDLNAYILAGIQSDHECTKAEEAAEKLRRGMYLMLREGSTEHNLSALLPVVTPCSLPRCSFATDDRHADLLEADGHIDDCIRRAIAEGLKPEFAYRMATLSAAERFGLHDRGAIAPGYVADFCFIDDSEEFTVLKTVKNGVIVRDLNYQKPGRIDAVFSCRLLLPEDLKIVGKGNARVIGLVPGQIHTSALQFPIEPEQLPDFDRDILKMVVCDRYHALGSGVGLVHGFGFTHGALACSVSHDSHNIIATGASDEEICKAVNEVIRLQGGMVAVCDDAITALPLDCGGLMSTLPYEDVCERLNALNNAAEQMGGIASPFMYLSFLALTVIPELRLTNRGVFDVLAFADVPLFEDGL